MLQFNGHDAEFELILICYFVLQQRTDIILPLYGAHTAFSNLPLW